MVLKYRDCAALPGAAAADGEMRDSLSREVVAQELRRNSSVTGIRGI